MIVSNKGGGFSLPASMGINRKLLNHTGAKISMYSGNASVFFHNKIKYPMFILKIRLFKM